MPRRGATFDVSFSAFWGSNQPSTTTRTIFKRAAHAVLNERSVPLGQGGPQGVERKPTHPGRGAPLSRRSVADEHGTPSTPAFVGGPGRNAKTSPFRRDLWKRQILQGFPD